MAKHLACPAEITAEFIGGRWKTVKQTSLVSVNSKCRCMTVILKPETEPGWSGELIRRIQGLVAWVSRSLTQAREIPG